QGGPASGVRSACSLHILTRNECAKGTCSYGVRKAHSLPMRAHRQIIEDADGDQGIVRALGSPPGVRPGRVRFWRRRNSIPAEWWSALAQSGVASLDELAAAVASPVSSFGHASTLAPVETLGAENPERNVS